MTDSTLSITVRDTRTPCAPYFSTTHQFFVDILHCDYTPLRWKGRTYLTYPLKLRTHDQIKVPPGFYIIRGYATCHNVLLELAVVQVSCNSTVCVSLLPTTVRFCIDRVILGIKNGSFATSKEEKIKNKVSKEKIDKAVRALREIEKDLPEDEFSAGLPVSPAELEKMEKEIGKKEQYR